ncbi:MAG: NAD(P)-binding protein [Lentisphaeria bacterium]|nr:NAD(P)-binding protein [Lentisphaeria bacterium]
MAKIAIIGSGISGLTSAHLLSTDHDITVFEKNNYIGGHTNTIDVKSKSGNHRIDTGFIVFNNKTYPNFQKLMDKLEVPYQDTRMGFSVRQDSLDLEYSGESLNGFFANKKEILSPRIYKLIYEIIRFNKQIEKLDENTLKVTTLKKFLNQENYSDFFIHSFIIPMGAAIWSSSPQMMYDFPLAFFVRFFNNHGFLNVVDRVIWRVIQGGSNSYIPPLIKNFKDNIKLNSDIKSIQRTENEVLITLEDEILKFDHVILACHSDQVLPLLIDATENEINTFEAMQYKKNTAILHTDVSLLPKREAAWASWNFLEQANEELCVTYHMNILQGVKSSENFLVTLNSDKVAPEKIIKTIEYSHPHFTEDFVNAQQNWDLINGKQNTWFCGAYWRYGFHEDGVVSALWVCDKFGVSL